MGVLKRFENCTAKLSAKETEWTLLEIRRQPIFFETLISKYDIGPVKLPGLSRNGPLAGNIPCCVLGEIRTLTVPLST